MTDYYPAFEIYLWRRAFMSFEERLNISDFNKYIQCYAYTVLKQDSKKLISI